MNKILLLNEMNLDYNKKIEILKNDNDLKGFSSQKALEFEKNLKCKYITLFDKAYPKLLKLLANPPLVIYYVGDIELLNKHLVSVLGSVNPCLYSKKATSDIIKTISNSKVIISNYSYGNSHVALINAVKYKKITIATVSYGFDYIDFYKYKILNEIKKNGLVFSITPYFQTSNFINYNKTLEAIIMLSESILVMEAQKNSVSTIAASFGSNFDKDIYVLPGSIYDENFSGCNELIQDGANILYNGIKL